jgi:hypothetical protein
MGNPDGRGGGALVSAAILLGPALVLLGTLGPLAVRLTATGAADSGRKAGDCRYQGFNRQQEAG